MPWLPLYCSKNDVPALLDMLDDDLAFIVSDGPKRWRAVAEFNPATKSRTALWHIPSGPLPRLGGEYLKPNGVPDVWPDEEISNPKAGWTEARSGADPNTPYFGPNCAGIFWLNLNILGHDTGSSCGMSSIEWGGNRYPSGARKTTQNRWVKLKRQVAKTATKVPRGGLLSDNPAEIWAFPDALKHLDTADINPA